MNATVGSRHCSACGGWLSRSGACHRCPPPGGQIITQPPSDLRDPLPSSLTRHRKPVARDQRCDWCSFRATRHILVDLDPSSDGGSAPEVLDLQLCDRSMASWQRQSQAELTCGSITVVALPLDPAGPSRTHLGDPDAPLDLNVWRNLAEGGGR
jgi:hypothetical protein